MKRYKVLIADDEVDMVEGLRDRLRASGFDTIEAYEGIRVVEQAHKEKPDLIILDLIMPVGTGQTVLKTLRSRPDTKDIPVIVLTALSAQEVKEEVMASGAQFFFQKPCDTTKLVEKITELLSEKTS